jgi:hypothetical protein
MLCLLRQDRKVGGNFIPIIYELRLKRIGDYHDEIGM